MWTLVIHENIQISDGRNNTSTVIFKFEWYDKVFLVSDNFDSSPSELASLFHGAVFTFSLPDTTSIIRKACCSFA